MMTKLQKRLDDLSDAVKERQRIGAEKVRIIEVIGDGWVETWNLETHTHTRVYDQDEQTEQAS